MRLDPGNYQFRSCAFVFFATRQYDRARAFLRLDAGSEWSNNVEINLLLREGKISEAVERLRKLPDSSFFHTRAVLACYEKPQTAGARKMLEQFEKDIFAYRDPEPKYGQATLFNSCLGNTFTARLIQSAIEGGFCAYESMQSDPLLAAFRKTPEYSSLLAQAKQCQDRFLAERDRP
jgi:hypothetical protein